MLQSPLNVEFSSHQAQRAVRGALPYAMTKAAAKGTMENAARAAAIYNVHGNLSAPEVILSDPGRDEPDLIVVGRDVASGLMPAEVLDRLEAMGNRVRWVCGNPDRQTVSPTTVANRRSMLGCPTRPRP